MLHCAEFSPGGYYHFTSASIYKTDKFDTEQYKMGYGECGDDGAVVGMECFLEKCGTLQLHCRKWGFKPVPLDKELAVGPIEVVSLSVSCPSR